MPKQQEQIDELHQHASSQYLDGEFAAALETWRRLLALDPENERALEGVRLCELLAEEGEGVATPAAPSAEPMPAESSADDTLAELDELLAGKLDNVDAPPAEAAGPELPDPARQAEGIDFGEAGEPDTLAVAGEAPEFDFDFGELDQQVAPTAETAATTAAAAELSGRADLLLAEARGAFAAGNTEAAQGVLTRLFILDETHEQARALQMEIEAAPASPSATVADSEQTQESLEPEAAPPDLELDLQVPPVEPAPVVEADGEPVEDPLEYGDTVPELEPQSETPLKPLRKSSGLPRWAVLGVVGVVVLTGGLFLGLRWMRGAGSVEPLAGPAVDGVDPAAASSPRPRSGPEPDSPVAPLVAADPRSLEELLTDADVAFEGEDFAAAVVAYDLALKLDPQNGGIAQRLNVAGERYREKQQLAESWQTATRSFEQGDYRQALTLFYRLSDEDGSGRLDRYRRNGWYNLGIQSLQAGRCREARENLDEARGLDESDPAVIAALQITARCSSEGGSASYEQDVDRLVFRTLESGPSGS